MTLDPCDNFDSDADDGDDDDDDGDDDQKARYSGWLTLDLCGNWAWTANLLLSWQVELLKKSQNLNDCDDNDEYDEYDDDHDNVKT